MVIKFSLVIKLKMNFDNKCRTCLRIPEQPTDLFKDNDNLLNIIQSISSIKIEYVSELPTQVCEECCTNLYNFYNFRQIIINTDLELRSMVETLKKTPSNIKIEPSSGSSFDIDIMVKSEIQENIDHNEDSLEGHVDIMEKSLVKKIRRKIFNCSVCELVFTTRHQLYNHKRSSHIPPRTCNICGLTVRPDSFKRHLNNRHGGITDPDNCQRDDEPALVVEKVLKCQDCEDVFNTSHELYRHRKRNHKAPQICNICGKTLVNADGFKKHLETHFRKRCSKCGKRFKNLELLQSHMRVHAEQDFPCEICPKTFTSKQNLQTHRHKLHVSPGICNICGKVVRSDNLKKHLSIHTEGPQSCDKCGKTMKNSQSLRSHKLMHIEQEFMCEICGKRSESKRCHLAHLRVHKDSDKTTVCVQCGKKVNDISSHMRIHRERKFTCSQCDRRFRRAHHLKVHTRQHTREKPYECEKCDKSFAQSVSLRTHMRTKH